VNAASLALHQAKRRLAGTTITAPIAGRVLSVAGAVGSQVSPGGSGFIVLADVSGMALQTQFSETDAIGLAVGQATTIILPAREGESLTGKVSEVAVTATATATATDRLVTYRVLVAFDTVPDGLLVGQSGTAAVVIREASGVLRVPAAAVRPAAGGGFEVTMAAGAGRAVEIGLRGDGYVEIRSGLTEGEAVRAVGR
jgi:HlyD family secretion protein